MAAVIDSATAVESKEDSRRVVTRRGLRFGRRRGGGPRRVPWVWVLPGLALAVAIQYLPVISGAWDSLTSWTGIGPAHFIGLKNFSNIFIDPNARGALEHTLELAAAYVVFVNLFGLALAIGLNRTLKTRNFIRALFFARSS
jgi:raffinose/stachyose/melibiose transport system permease protein